jgi:hypothetical protein
MTIAGFLVFGVIVFGNVLKSSDYEASNQTGNNTPYTNQTTSTYGVVFGWYEGLAFILIVIVIGLIFKFMMR